MRKIKLLLNFLLYHILIAGPAFAEVKDLKGLGTHTKDQAIGGGQAIYYLAQMGGLGVAVWGVFGLVQSNRMGGEGKMAAFGKIIVGAIALCIGVFLDFTSQTTMGVDAEGYSTIIGK